MDSWQIYELKGEKKKRYCTIEANTEKEAMAIAKNLNPRCKLMARKIVELKCNNCKYEWSTRGIRTRSATCPSCFRQVKLK